MPIVLPEERVGTVIADRYRISAVLGEGGMGAVFSAVHEWTGRAVAVKFLSPALARDDEASRRFLQEARAAARLDHPNVVDVLDMGRTDDGAVYLVLEHLEGEDLQALLKREGKLDVDRTLDLLLPTLDALGEAHQLGITHRDIKPSNIFIATLRGASVAKVLDFGIAQMRGDAEAVRTQTGRVLGTPHYMAPEQVVADGVSGPHSDVWSMGVLLYRCLAGVKPVQGRTAAEIMMKVVSEPRPPLTSVASHVPPAIGHVIDVALEREVDDRHRSMGEFAEALRRAASSTGIVATARVQGGVKELPEANTPGAEVDGVTAPTEIGPEAVRRGASVADLETRELSAPEHSREVTTPFVSDTPVPRSGGGRWGFVLGLSLLALVGVGALLFALGRAPAPGMTVSPLPSAGDTMPVERSDAARSDASRSNATASDPASDDVVPTTEGGSGQLTVRANRSCILTIDGVAVGGTPVLDREIAVGARELTCRSERGELLRASIAVAADEHVEHAFRFTTGRSRRRGMAAGAASETTAAMATGSPDITRDYD